MNNKKAPIMITLLFLIAMLTSCDFYFSDYIPSWMEGTWEDDAIYKTTTKIGSADATKEYNSSSYKLVSNSSNYTLYSYEDGDTSDQINIRSSYLDKDIFNFVKRYSEFDVTYSSSYLENSENITSGFNNQYTSHTTNNFSYQKGLNNVDVEYTFDITLTPKTNSSTQMYLKIQMQSTVAEDGQDSIVSTYGFDSSTGLPILVSKYTNCFF
jgi:hypothetical protein